MKFIKNSSKRVETYGATHWVVQFEPLFLKSLLLFENELIHWKQKQNKSTYNLHFY